MVATIILPSYSYYEIDTILLVHMNAYNLLDTTVLTPYQSKTRALRKLHLLRPAGTPAGTPGGKRACSFNRRRC